MVRRIMLPILYLLSFLIAQIVLPTFQGVHKTHSSSSGTGTTVDGFSGQTGPEFDGWTQCEGYLDQSGGDDIPLTWGDDCTDDSYTKIKLCCGEDTDTYRYIDVNRNVFADGLTGYSQTGLILESKDQDGNDFSVQNIIYATSSHPHNFRSWWGGGAGCNESSTNLTINNYCQMEAANCFGQNIGNGNNRYLWVYVQ